MEEGAWDSNLICCIHPVSVSVTRENPTRALPGDLQSKKLQCEIVYEKSQLKNFVDEAFKAAEKNPILIDKFLDHFQSRFDGIIYIYSIFDVILVGSWKFDTFYSDLNHSMIRNEFIIS